MIALKNEEHIDCLRESGAILAGIFKVLKGYIKPGVTPKDIDLLVRKIMEEKGAIPSFLGYSGFPAAVCTSVNEQVIHGIPSNKPLKEGDIIGCDIGVTYKGMISDAARTYKVGKVSPQVEQLLEITKKSLMAGIEAIRPNGRVKDISKAVTSVIEPHGYGIVHSFCGHGVGFEVHEDPQIPNNYPSRGKNPRLKPGMVLAIEPMVNLGTAEVEILDDEWTVVTQDGALSAHFEHTVVVTKEGYEIMTGSLLDD
ncbi:MAG: type I methionyl aminopeptidase [Spirochaetales bacterium]|nr:type I methionyl aminopeptidase [Spirochaetales bacterium]